MALPPVSDLHPEIQSTNPSTFAARRPLQDVVILEPNEPGRDYTDDLHGLASYVFLQRAANQPVPVGRDARAVVLLDHAAVSRLHMVMAWTGNAWQFMDRSSNGVFLHEQRVPKEQPTTLNYGTPIRLGKALMLRVLTPEGLHALVTKVRSAAPAAAAFDAPAWASPNVDPFAATGAQAAPAAVPPPPDAQPLPDQPAFPTAPPPPPAFNVPPPPPVPTPVTEEFELDFDFADAPVDPDFVGDGYDSDVADAYMAPSAPPQAPQAPVVPSPPPPAPAPDDISFDIDFDDVDGRGGFA